MSGGDTSPPSLNISVPANVGAPGVDTGVDLLAGEGVVVNAFGSAQYGYDACVAGQPNTLVTTDPDGNRKDAAGTVCNPLAKKDGSAPDPTSPIGTLIGRVGTTGPWFPFGGSRIMNSSTAGRFYLMYNDSYAKDNTGSYSAQVSVGIEVPANVGGNGVATGVNASPDEPVQINAHGSASYGREGQSGCYGQAYTDPNGNRSIPGTGPPIITPDSIIHSSAPTPCVPAQKIDGSAPAPTKPIGSLIYRFGTTDPWKLAGSSIIVSSSHAGQLYLRYNDPGPSDNLGGFQVAIRAGSYVAPPPPPVVVVTPTESSAAVVGTDSTGGHFLQITGTGLDSVTHIIYGVPSAPGILPPPCPMVEGTLMATTSTCLYTVTSSDHNAGGPTLLKPSSPPQADLAHVTLVSPFARSATFAFTNVPVEPKLSGVGVIGSHVVFGNVTEPTILELFGSGLTNITDVIFGQVHLPTPPLACPTANGGLLAAGLTCSYTVTASDLAFHPGGTADTNFTVPVPPGADLSHVTAFSAGGWSNTVSASHLPPAPVVTTATATFNGNGSGQVFAGGTGLNTVTQVLLGQPTNGSMPNPCPYDGSGPLPIVGNIACVEPVMLTTTAGDPATLGFTIPPGATLPGTNDGGNLTHVVLLSAAGPSNAFAVQVPAKPQVDSIESAGTATDGRPLIRLHGSHLDGASVADFGSVSTTAVKVLSDNLVEVEVPLGSGTVTVVVNNRGGSSNPMTLTYPTVTGLSLLSGAPAGATSTLPNGWVAISGTGITAQSGGAPKVFFGIMPSPEVVVSGSTVIAQAPNLQPGDPSSVYVIVRTPTGDSPNSGACPGTASDCFAYPAVNTPGAWGGEFGPPSVASVSPSAVTAAGTPLTLVGSGFTGATQVQVGGTSLSPCPGPRGCFAVTDDGTITFPAPALSAGQSYPIKVSNPSGESNGVQLGYASAPSAGGGTSIIPISPPAVGSGPPTPASGLTETGPSFGPFSTAGHWAAQGGGVYTATGTVTFNGLKLVPRSGVTITLNTTALTLTTSGSVEVSLAAVNIPGVGSAGPFVLYNDTLNWTLSAASLGIDLSHANIAGIPLSGAATLLLPSGVHAASIAGTDVSATPSAGGVVVQATTTLPGMLGGGTAQVRFRTTSAGIDPTSLNVSLGKIALGGLVTVDGAQLRYNPAASGWFVSGNAQAAGGTQITGSITFSAGAVSSGTLKAQSTSLAGLIGIKNLTLDYQNGAGAETWAGSATDTDNNKSTFKFSFDANGLQTGSVKVPHASVAGVFGVDGLDFEYSSGNWSVTTSAHVTGVASMSGGLVVSQGVVQSGHIQVDSPSLASLISIPSVSLTYDGTTPGTETWSGTVGNGSSQSDFTFTWTQGVLTSGALNIPSASLGGVVTLSDVAISFDKVHWSGSGTAQVAGVAQGSVSLDLSYDEAGKLTAGTFDASGGSIGGGLTVNSLHIGYQAANQEYDGSIDVTLPGPLVHNVLGTVRFAHGAFQAASLDVSGDVPIGPGLAIRHGSLAVTMNPLKLTGSLTVAAGPQVPLPPSGAFGDALDATGTLTYLGPNGSAPGDWDIKADVKLLGNHTLGSADINMNTSGAVTFSGTLGLSIPGPFGSPVVSITARLSGYANSSGFGATASAKVTIFGWSPQAALAFSNVGLEGCGDTGVAGIRAGFKDRWGQVPSFWGGCNVGEVDAANIAAASVSPPVPYATESTEGPHLRAAALNRAVLASTVAVPSWQVPAGQKAAAFSVEGQGGLASFKLVAPDKTAIDIPALTPSGTLLGNGKVFVLEDIAGGSTYLIVANPAAGTWSVQTDAGSVPVFAIHSAAILPNPTVSGSVASTPGSAQQTLTWSATDAAGDTVTFLEEGAGLPNRTLGTSSASSGALSFLPGDGPAGTRQIVAQIDRQGLPVATQQVATYTAPAPVAPPAPTNAVFAPSPTGLQLSWSAPSTDGGTPITSYRITDGATVLGVVPGSHTSATVPGSAAGHLLTITAVNAAGIGGGVTVQTAAGATPGAGSGVPAGGTFSSDPPGSSSATRPLVVSVQPPLGGVVGVTKTGATSGSAPTGYVDTGVGAIINAPSGSPSSPLRISFEVAGVQLPAGVDLQELTVTRDGVVAGPCANPAVATPDPCVASIQTTASGVVVSVLSSHASTWRVVATRTDRLSGADRIGTAIAVSQASFGAGSAGAGVLARSDDYADALAGGPLASAKHGPVLLTHTAALDSVVAAELSRSLAPHSTVYLLGGTGALSPAVESALTSLGFTPVRLSGGDRFATAVAVAQALGNPATLLVTTGTNFPDALAAGTAAAAQKGAVLLSDGTRMPGATAAYLGAHPGAKVFAIGGPAATAVGPSATAVVGNDRFDTALAVAKQFFPAATGVGLASGRNYPDALAAGPMLASLGEPLLLTEPASLSGPVTAYLAQPTLSALHLFGGSNALEVNPSIGG
ncbi:MAG: hypothetical protein NVS3B12_27570 [Acidimicrobiales bacterium]